MRRRVAVLVAGLGLLLAGCTAGHPAAEAPVHASSSPSSPAAPAASVRVTPADGADGVSPSTPLTVAVTGGQLAAVSVVDADGVAVSGALDDAATPAGRVWTPTQPLGYATTYTLTATARGVDGRTARSASTFTTVAPRTTSAPSIGPLDGSTVGVAMPIRVYFDHPVTDRAEVQRHLVVDTTRPTDGTWSWFGDEEVHFRPSTYWPAGTQVTLHADLYGVQLGDGVWGAKDRTVSFAVGAAHRAVADAAAHTFTVHDGDRVVRTVPMSAGSAANPTRNGTHVVLQGYRKIVMDSSTFGLAVDAPGGYRTDVEYAVRISNNGEFVHAAPWSVRSQGRANVSHGCINLSTANAAWYYGYAQPGDPVEVVGSIGPTLSRVDGDIYDWAVPWSTWQAGSALR